MRQSTRRQWKRRTSGFHVAKRRGKVGCPYSGTFVTAFAVNVPNLKDLSDLKEHATLSLFYNYFSSCSACFGGPRRSASTLNLKWFSLIHCEARSSNLIPLDPVRCSYVSWAYYRSTARAGRVIQILPNKFSLCKNPQTRQTYYSKQPMSSRPCYMVVI